MIEIIAFDADDTLWHNEHFYSETKKKFEKIISKYTGNDRRVDYLDKLEEKNIAYYGYGIKSFTLSMIEAAIEMTAGNISGKDIHLILQLSKEMLDQELLLLDGVEETLSTLSERVPLMIITKGDLFEQHRKVLRSGIADYFEYIEVVAEKTVDVYRALMHRYRITPEHFLMIGNSLRSDIQPLVQLGAQAVYVPYATTWAHEFKLEEQLESHQYFEVARIDEVISLIQNIKADLS